MHPKSVLYIAVTILFSNIVIGQSYLLQDYVLSEIGNEYQYDNLVSDGMDTILVGVSAEVEFDGITTLRRDENNGDYRLQTLDENGLTIYWLYFIGDRVIEYEKPVIQMPAVLKVGQIHFSATNYTYLEDGVVKDKGVQKYEVETMGLEDIVIGKKKIKNCLKIITRASRIGQSGKEKGYELTEWYAKDIGPVKVTGPLYWNDENGNRTRTFQIDAEVEKTTIRGQLRVWK